MPLLAVRARDHLGRGWFGPPVYQLAPRSFGGGYVGRRRKERGSLLPL
jgi:hypothetical protein